MTPPIPANWCMFLPFHTAWPRRHRSRSLVWSTSIGCQDSNTKKDVAVLFQRLAPGLAGIDMIDWRVPSHAPTRGFFLFCQIPDAGPWIEGFVPVGR